MCHDSVHVTTYSHKKINLIYKYEYANILQASVIVNMICICHLSKYRTLRKVEEITQAGFKPNVNAIHKNYCCQMINRD